MSLALTSGFVLRSLLLLQHKHRHQKFAATHFVQNSACESIRTTGQLLVWLFATTTEIGGSCSAEKGVSTS